MKKIRLFIESFLVYGLGGIISKMIPLVMLPIITRIMPSTEYFGLSDMANTVANFGSAIAILGMYDAMYRLFFDKDDEEYKKSVCSTTFFFTVILSIVTCIVMVVNQNNIARIFFGDEKYAYLVCITSLITLTSATNSIVSAPTRMQNKRIVFLGVNIIGSILSYLVAVPLIIKGYYVIALPIGALVSGLVIESAFLKQNYRWFQIKSIDIELWKQLLSIALPLFPNFLIYWIFNSCDKIMITNILGVGEAGVYSIGAKLGAASQLIYTAFAGGWQYFAFSTMKDNDQVKSNSNIFELLGIISFVTTILVSACSHSFYDLLFPSNYVRGYIVAPYLFLAPLLQMLFQVACNQFIIIKKTWPNMFILMSGAIVNVILNWILIPKIGIEGAALATLTGYMVADLICVIVLVHMKLMIISKQFVVSCIIAITVWIMWRMLFCANTFIGIIWCIFGSMLITLPYIRIIFLKIWFK